MAAPTKTFAFSVQGLELGADMLTMWIGASATGVYLLPPEDRSITLTYDNGSTYFDHPYTFGRYVFIAGARPGGSRDGFVFSAPSTFGPVVQPSPQVVVDINGDGASLVWIQADRQTTSLETYQNASLWRSPLVTAAADLVPTKLRDLGTVLGAFMSVAGSGYVAATLTPDHFDIFRISDGRHWVANWPVGYEPKIMFPWIDEEYFFYQVARSVPGRKVGIVRQRLDALGPGE